jgi:UTP--glucose-1-phosphate uridylyltransferase
VVAVQSLRREATSQSSQNGIVKTADDGAHLARVVGIVDKAPADTVRSNQAVVGRYVFSPRILDCLDGLQPGTNNEVQLTDGIARLLSYEAVYAYRFQGDRFYCGSKLGFLEATLAYASKHPELGREFRVMVTAMARQLQSARMLPKANASSVSSSHPTRPASRVTPVSR